MDYCVAKPYIIGRVEQPASLDSYQIIISNDIILYIAYS